MKRYKVSEVLRKLREDGWYQVSQRGSHRQFKHPVKKGRVTINCKNSDTIDQSILNSIWKQAGGNNMGRIRILVDYTDNFSACPENDSIACVTTANTYESLKKNMDEALHFHIEGMKEDNEMIPEEFSGDWEYEWVLSTRALLHATESYVPKSVLAKITGINQQQLTHYASGFRKPKPAMSDRIREGIHSIALTLLSY